MSAAGQPHSPQRGNQGKPGLSSGAYAPGGTRVDPSRVQSRGYGSEPNVDRPGWQQETQRVRRGHDFYPPDIGEAPGFPYGADGEESETPVHLRPVVARYFGGAATFYVLEVDQGTGEYFGLVSLGNGYRPELGYGSLPEIEAANVHRGLTIMERDLHFDGSKGIAGDRSMPAEVSDWVREQAKEPAPPDREFPSNPGGNEIGDITLVVEGSGGSWHISTSERIEDDPDTGHERWEGDVLAAAPDGGIEFASERDALNAVVRYSEQHNLPEIGYAARARLSNTTY